MLKLGLSNLGTIALTIFAIGLGTRALADEAPNAEPTAIPTPASTKLPSSRGPFAISVGAAFLTSHNDLASPAVGLQYSFASQPAGMAFAYLDLRTLVTYSVGAVGLGYSTESLTNERAYGGIGVSYSYAYFIGSACPCLVPPCVDNCGNSNAGSTSGVGGKLFGGFDFAPGLSLEASYQLSPQVGVNNTNAAGLSLKYRF